MIRVPEPDPPEVRSRPTWPTPLGRCRAMHCLLDVATLRATYLAPWFELEDASSCRAHLWHSSQMQGVPLCLRSTRLPRPHRAQSHKSRPIARCHKMTDLSRGEDLPCMQQASSSAH